MLDSKWTIIGALAAAIVFAVLSYAVLDWFWVPAVLCLLGVAYLYARRIRGGSS
jgi:hypothetical protein